MIASEELKTCLSRLKSDVDSIIQVLEAENLRTKSGANSNEQGFLICLQEIDAFQEALTNALSEARARFIMCAERRKHACSALLPINCLPPEILIHVFEYVVELASFNSHYRLLYQLACVSSRWKAIAESSPSLWTRISSRYTLSHALNILRKSSKMPLVVQAEFPSPTHGDLAQALRNCAPRWNALELSACGILMDSGWTMSFRRLRYMSWRGDPLLDPPRRRLESVALRDASLEGVALHNVSLDFLSDAFASLSSLKYLKLDNLGALQCTVPCLSLMLANNPRLEHVAINSVYTNLAVGEKFAPLSLPFLTTFSATSMPPDIIASIFRCLDAPRLKTLNASGHQRRASNYNGNMTDVMSELLRAAAHSHFAWISTLALKVAIYQSGWQVEAIGIQQLDKAENKNYTLWLGSDLTAQPEAALKALTDGFGENITSVTPTLLYLTGNDHWFITAKAYKALHDLMPSVEVLIFTMQYRPSAVTLCSFLGQPSDSGHWPFPSLHCLDLYLGPNKNGAVVPMLRNRVSAPTRIRRLNLQTSYEPTDPMILKAREVLGQAAVTINEPVQLAEPNCWGTEGDVEEWLRLPM